METTNLSFRVTKQVLTEAVSQVAHHLPTSSAQPILRALLLTADEDTVECSGYDLEVSNQIRFQAEVDQPGRIAVAGKLLADICKNLPNQLITCEVEGSQLKVSCAASRFEIPLIPLDEYPPLPSLPASTGSLEPKAFKKAIMQVSAAAASDKSDTLPMLTGILISISGQKLKLTATDRFRLTMRTLEWTPAQADIEAKLLIPARKLEDYVRALDVQSPEPVELAVGNAENVGADGLFGLETQNWKTTMRMLDGDFPNVDPLFPKTHTSMAAVNIAQLQEACKRVSVVSSQNDPIRLSFSADELRLTASGNDAGHAEESIPCEYTGDEQFDIAFNQVYLLNGLSVLDSDRVVFGFNESSRPAIMIPETESLPPVEDDGTYKSPTTDFIYLLMPVRLPG